MSNIGHAWRRGAPLSNVPNRNVAPFGVEQNGKLVFDRKTDIKKLAVRIGATRIFDRLKEEWLPFDPDTGKILETVAQKQSASLTRKRA